MPQTFLPVKDIQPLTNVRRLQTAIKEAKERSGHLPGIVGFYGPPGWGKSCAATFLANELDCRHIEIRPYWNHKKFFEELCIEVGAKLGGTIADMGGKISRNLRQPLIIDEIDIAIKKGFVDSVRGLFEETRVPIIIIGEETLATDLRQYERFHSRVLDWIPALPPELSDTTTLVKKFAHVDIADDLVMELHTISANSVRRICTNIERISKFASQIGVETIDLKTWKSGSGNILYGGEPPVRCEVAPVPGRGR